MTRALRPGTYRGAMLRGSRARTLVAVSLSGVLVGTLGAGCSLFESPPKPDDTARALATGLASGDLGAVTFKGTTPAKATAFVKAAYKDLGTLRPQVSLSEMSHTEGSDHATATLFSRWDVSTSADRLDLRDAGRHDSRRRPVAGVLDARRRGSPAHLRRDPRPRPQVAPARRHRRRLRRQDHDRARGRRRRHRQDEGVRAPRPRSRRRSSPRSSTSTPPRFAAKVEAAGSKAFVEGVTLRATDPIIEEQGAAIEKVKGALTVPALQVLGPSRTWAAPILGTVGEATAEQIEASKDALEAGDTVGKNGLQYRYDARLRGTPGLAVHAVKRGADGSVLDKRELFAEQSTEGEPLTITLDPKAQSAAEAALAKQTKHPTALVAVRVSTGEVLAAAVGTRRRRHDARPRRQGGAGLDVQDRQLARQRAQGRHGRHHAAVHRDADRQRPPVQQLHDLPQGQARRHPDADRPRLLVQHGLHQPVREGEPGRPRLRRAVARHGREARPALHRLPRLGADDRRRRRARSVVHRPGARRGLTADDGDRRRVGHEGPDGAPAARRRRARPAQARDAARPHRRRACCVRRCATSSPRGPARS